MSKYICPLCNSVHYNVDDLSACVSRDAKSIREKENKVKEDEKKKADFVKSLAEKRSEIEDLVIKLQSKINCYNTIGRQLATIDPKQAAHCTFSISYSEKDSNVDKKEIESRVKCWDDGWVDLSTLIDKTFNF